MKKLMLILPLVLFFGCIKNVKIVDYRESAKPMTNGKYKIIGDTEGLSSSFKLIFLINVHDKEANPLNAEEIAIAKESADNLIEVTTYRETIYIPIGKIEAYYVKGKAIKYEE